MDWSDISYLKSGNKKQQEAYRILDKLQILSTLREYSPIVVGTIPIRIDIASSDIDIVCDASSLSSFQALVRKHFSRYCSFSDYMKDNAEVYVARFESDNIEIEIYATHQPTLLQNGYRHMVIEDKILNLAGEQFQHEIIKLKNEGHKTESAFGKLLHLDNPYIELLRLEELSDEELQAFVSKHLIRD